MNVLHYRCEPVLQRAVQMINNRGRLGLVILQCLILGYGIGRFGERLADRHFFGPIGLHHREFLRRCTGKGLVGMRAVLTGCIVPARSGFAARAVDKSTIRLERRPGPGRIFGRAVVRPVRERHLSRVIRVRSSVSFLTLFFGRLLGFLSGGNLLIPVRVGLDRFLLSFLLIRGSRHRGRSAVVFVVPGRLEAAIFLQSNIVGHGLRVLPRVRVVICLPNALILGARRLGILFSASTRPRGRAGVDEVPREICDDVAQLGNGRGILGAVNRIGFRRHAILDNARSHFRVDVGHALLIEGQGRFGGPGGCVWRLWRLGTGGLGRVFLACIAVGQAGHLDELEVLGLFILGHTTLETAVAQPAQKLIVDALHLLGNALIKSLTDSAFRFRIRGHASHLWPCGGCLHVVVSHAQHHPPRGLTSIMIPP